MKNCMPDNPDHLPSPPTLFYQVTQHEPDDLGEYKNTCITTLLEQIDEQEGEPDLSATARIAFIELRRLLQEYNREPDPSVTTKEAYASTLTFYIKVFCTLHLLSFDFTLDNTLESEQIPYSEEPDEGESLDLADADDIPEEASLPHLTY